MNDKAHARKAVQLEKFASPATKAKINSRAKAMGIKVSGKAKPDPKPSAKKGKRK